MSSSEEEQEFEWEAGKYVRAPESDGANSDTEESEAELSGPVATSSVQDENEGGITKNTFMADAVGQASAEPRTTGACIDMNKSTRAAFMPAHCATNAGALGTLTYLLAPGHWPHKPFEEAVKHGEKRSSWVEWAGNFLQALTMIGIDDDKQKAGLFVFKGGAAVMNILGKNATSMTFQDMWRKTDEHYASLSDPSVDAAKYRSLRQNKGEDLLEFIDRLKKQAKLAEFSEDEEYKEQRIALLERSSFADQFRLQCKLKPNLTNTDLIALGRFFTTDEKTEATAATNIEVMAIERQDRKRPFRDFKEREPAARRQRITCASCGKSHEGRCLAKLQDKICFSCNGKGHFAIACPKKRGRYQESGHRADRNVQQVGDDLKNEDDWD